MWYFLISVLALGLFNPSVDANNLVETDTVIHVNSPQQNFATRSIGVEVTASSSLVIDVQSGNELQAKKPDLVVPIASISKLMTALVLLDTNLDWKNIVTLTPADEVYRAKYVFRGEEFTKEQLFWAMLIGSDNNATMALVRSSGFSTDEFVARMNKKAKDMGLVNTFFVDPTGLSSQNVSTARELAKLAKFVWNKPEILRPTSESQFFLNNANQTIKRKVINTNKLLNSFLEVEAGKTGFIDEAGYCLVALISDQDEHSIIVVTLGSVSEVERFQDTKTLAWWVFSNYLWL